MSGQKSASPFSSLNLAFIMRVVVACFFVSLISCLVILGYEYRLVRQQIDDEFASIEQDIKRGLTQSAWTANTELLKAQAEGIVGHRHIVHVKIVLDGMETITIGAEPEESMVVKSFPLVHAHNGQDIVLGTVHVTGGFKEMRSQLNHIVLFILFTQLSSAALVSLLVSGTFRSTVSNRLLEISSFVSAISLSTLRTPLRLSTQLTRRDEIDILTEGINAMRVNIDEQITERLRTEEALERSEDRFRMVFDQQFQFMAILTPDGTTLEVNSLVLETQKCSREDYVGKLFWDSPAWKGMPEKQEEIRAQVSKAIEMDGPLLVEDVYVTRGGEIRYADASYTAVRDDVGEARYVLVQATDITNKRLTEKALRESEERFNLAMSATRDGLYDWDLVSNEIYYSPGWKSMLGYEYDELPNDFSVWEKTTAPEDVKRSLALQQELINKQRDRFELEFKMKHKDGHWVDILSRANAIFDDSGTAVRMVGTHVDITERKQAEQTLLHAKKQAESANRVKSEFLANMSHEIRTPLNGIMGMLQLLETSVQDEEELQFCALAIQSTNRLNSLLSDILDLSRVEASMMLIRSQRFNLHSALTQVTDLFAPVAVQTGVTLIRHLDSTLPSWVAGDSIRLQQVLTNLIGNAFKFTKSGHVRVEAFPLPSLSNDTSRIFFAIEDTGSGIADEKLGNLFQPFSQISQGYTRNHQGAGLGLTISKQLVGLMGGNMAVESEEGVGSTFYFCVTLGKEVQPHDGEVTAESRTAPPVYFRILLAEDDETTVFSISKLLEKSGHSVAVAHNGQEALEMYAVNDFDLILMDVQMPIMDGINACQRIRGSAPPHKRDIPIIALTAYAMAGDKEKFLAAGMSGYVAKPVNMEILMQVMSETLAEQQR